MPTEKRKRELKVIADFMNAQDRQSKFIMKKFEDLENTIKENDRVIDNLGEQNERLEDDNHALTAAIHALSRRDP